MNKWVKFFQKSSLIRNSCLSLKNSYQTLITINPQKKYSLFLSLNPRVNLHELEKLYDLIGLVRRPPHKVNLALQNSYSILTLSIKTNQYNKLIGFARVISDHAFNATIWDMAIHPNYQKQGLGSIVIGKLIQELRYLGIDTITLFADSQSIKFYNKLGFLTDPQNTRGMFWYPK